MQNVLNMSPSPKQLWRREIQTRSGEDAEMWMYSLAQPSSTWLTPFKTSSRVVLDCILIFFFLSAHWKLDFVILPGVQVMFTCAVVLKTRTFSTVYGIPEKCPWNLLICCPPSPPVHHRDSALSPLTLSPAALYVPTINRPP